MKGAGGLLEARDEVVDVWVRMWVMLLRKRQGDYLVFVGAHAVVAESCFWPANDEFIKLILAMFFEGFDRINKI